ncbi:hypothetical protein [Oscillatoria sp. FACHB-1406]|uniref:hypothetical protein n=1 Tax=Oscillatoria sp. FACHB-1406 TaxID=2692846 RepID=UPI00168547DA|nr:hypothetical protein [Oscillatoria sp. FACHB-1406]MBD2579296.1 hypothetical protein [Oscillatoria sp. FACHB-1406]
MVQRLEEILGSSIQEYTPNAIKFEGLSLVKLEQLIEEKCTSRTSSFNAAPSVGAFVEFGHRCESHGATATFDGVAFAKPDNPDLVVDTITVIGVQDLDFAGEFVRFAWGCDELDINSQMLFAWWD